MSPWRLRTVALFVACLALPLGCGAKSDPQAGQGGAANRRSTPSPSTPPADVIVAKSLQLLQQAKRVRVVGDTPPDSGSLHVDYRYYDGNFDGTSLTDSGLLQLRIIGDTAYVYAPLGFWRKSAAKTHFSDAQLAKLSNMWISETATEAQKQSVNLQTVLQPLEDEAKSPDLAKTSVTRSLVAGRPAFTVGNQPDTFQVAASGASYLLALRYSDNGTEKQLSFTQYGATAPVVPPAGARTVREVLLG
jgi:hypothetical protein